MLENITYDLILLDSGYTSSENEKVSNVDLYTMNGNEWEITKQYDDSVGHGISVMSIISNNYKGNYVVFKTFDTFKEANIEKIISALTYIYENMSTRYIQMSFGVRGDSKELDSICRRLYERGCIILAAFDNYGAISYPSGYDYVVGVSGDVFCLKKNDFTVNRTGIVDVLAKSSVMPGSKKSKNGFALRQGNSFAVSYVSLYLLESERKFENKEQVLSYLDKEYKPKKTEKEFSCLGNKVAIFPLNKEMFNLIHYAELLKVTIEDVYDIKYTGNLNKLVSNLDKTITFNVKNIEHCEWKRFDTMIVGHLRELGMLLGRNLKREILQQCLEHKKNVYCYDLFEVEEFRDKFELEGLKLECAEDYVKNDNYGKMYMFKTPTLAILGTSKKQGKFTLLMQIKKLMSEHGIDIGVLGTEPNSILLGTDAMIPIGYDSQINRYSGQYIMEACNEQMHKVDTMEYQLILTAGQSGFAPHFKFNSNQININQIPFLYGVQPDGVILVINYRDQAEYIKKSIDMIETISNAKVFLLAMYAFDVAYDNIINSNKTHLSKQQIEEKQSEMQKEFGLELVIPGENEYNDTIFEQIIKYYC